MQKYKLHRLVTNCNNVIKSFGKDVIIEDFHVMSNITIADDDGHHQVHGTMALIGSWTLTFLHGSRRRK